MMINKKEQERILKRLENITRKEEEELKKMIESDLKPLTQSSQCSCCYCNAQRVYGGCISVIENKQLKKNLTRYFSAANRLSKQLGV